MGRIVNKSELSEVLGVSQRTLTTWQREPGFPIEAKTARGRSNRYDTADVIKWMLQRSGSSPRQESHVERLNRVKADREEMLLAKETGDLIPAKETREALFEVATAIRTNLQAGNSKLKAEIDTLYDTNLDISILHEHSRQILNHLAELDIQPGGSGDRGLEGLSSAADDVDAGVGE